MGAWGNGNFEKDVAYDYLGILLTHIVLQIREAIDRFKNELEVVDFSGDGNGQIVAHIDIMTTLSKHYETYPEIRVTEVEDWKTIALKAFDSDMRQRGSPDSKYAKHRRPVIVETFDKLIELVSEFEE